MGAGEERISDRDHRSPQGGMVSLGTDVSVLADERDERSFWYLIAWGLLLVTAAAIRFRTLGTSLFEDEVWVANLVRHGGWHPHSYSTPPLFYAVQRGWAALRGISDVSLREPAAIFGVALCAAPLAAPLSRLSRFTWGVLLAFSSPLIFYSTHLKQYTLEAFVGAILIVLFLHWRQSESPAFALAFFVIAAAGVTTLFCTVFLLPAFALLSLRRPRMLAGFAAVFTLFGLAYFGWLAPGAESTRLHGDMTAYFAANGRWITSPSSFIAGTLHWTGQAMNLVRFWWLAFALLALTWLVRERDIVMTTLALLPPLSVGAASMLHLYPYGEVRLMIFCLPGLFLLLASAIGSVTRRAPMLLLLLAPFVLAGLTGDPYNHTYMHVDDLQPMFEMLVRSHVPGETIYADPSFGSPLRYECPSLAADIHMGIERTMTMPGWYVQRLQHFRPVDANVTMRIGDVIVARNAP